MFSLHEYSPTSISRTYKQSELSCSTAQKLHCSESKISFLISQEPKGTEYQSDSPVQTSMSGWPHYLFWYHVQQHRVFLGPGARLWKVLLQNKTLCTARLALPYTKSPSPTILPYTKQRAHPLSYLPDHNAGWGTWYCPCEREESEMTEARYPAQGIAEWKP